MPEKIGLEAVLEDKDFQKGVKDYDAGIDKMEGANKDMVTSSGGLRAAFTMLGDKLGATSDSAVDFRASMESLQAGLEGVKELVGTGLELAELGAQAERVEDRFEAFAEAAGGAEEILEGFQEGAGGAASKMDAMQSASRLLQMGLVGSRDEMSNVVEMATRLGDQTQSVASRVEDFSLLLSNTSIPRLDNFGISSGNVRARIKELQAATEDLTREDAFMIATFEEGAKSLDVLGERIEDNAMSFERAEARMADMRVEMGQKLAPIAASLMDIVAGMEIETLGLVSAIGSAVFILPKLISAIKSLGAVLKIASAEMIILSGAVVALVIAYEKMNDVQQMSEEAADASIEVAKGLSDEIQNMIDRGGDLTDIYLMMSDKTDSVTAAHDDLKRQFGFTAELLGINADVGRVYAQIQREIQTSLLDNVQSYDEYIAALFAYNDNVSLASERVPILTKRQVENAIFMRGWTEETLGLNRELLEMDKGAKQGAESTRQLGYELEDGGFAADDFTGKIEITSTEMDVMTRATERGRYETVAHAAALESITQRSAEAAEAKRAAAEHARGLEEAQRAAALAAAEHEIELGRLAERLLDAEPAAVAREALAKLEELYLAGLVSEQEYRTELEQIQLTYGLASEESIIMADALDALQTATDNNIIPASRYNDALAFLVDNVEVLGADVIPAMVEEFRATEETGAAAARAVESFNDDVEETPGAAMEAVGELDLLEQKMQELSERAYSAGASLVHGLAAGVYDNANAFTGAIDFVLQKGMDMIPESEPKDPNSPLRGLSERGAIIAQLLFGGFEDEAEDQIDQLFDAAGVFSRLGSAAVRLFKEQEIDPTKDQLRDINDQLKEQARVRDQLQKQIDRGDLSRTERQRLEQIILANQNASNELERERVILAEKYAEQQERILKLQEQQQNLKFLEQQMKLIDLIAEKGLDAEEVLQGLTLGLDANLGDVIDAMARAMEEVIKQAEVELGISSPSKEFERIGEEAMRGMERGIMRLANLPIRASLIAAQTTTALPPALIGGGSSFTDNSISVNVPIQNRISSELDLALVESRITRAVWRGIRRE